jgi:hypothetical protein
VLYSTEEVEIRVCRTLSSPITIATNRVWRWHRSICYMVVGAELCCFRMRLESGRFFDPTYYKKSRDKFVWWEGTCGLRGQDRRVMSIISEESWVLKFEITCTSSCHLWEVYDVLRYETSSHLGSLTHSRSHRREVKYPWKIWVLVKITLIKSILLRF